MLNGSFRVNTNKLVCQMYLLRVTQVNLLMTHFLPYRLTNWLTLCDFQSQVTNWHYGYTLTEIPNFTASSRRQRWRFLCDSYSLPILHRNLCHGIINQTISTAATLFSSPSSILSHSLIDFNSVCFSIWSLILSVLFYDPYFNLHLY